MKNPSTKIFVFFFEYSIFINILQRFIKYYYLMVTYVIINLLYYEND